MVSSSAPIQSPANVHNNMDERGRKRHSTIPAIRPVASGKTGLSRLCKSLPVMPHFKSMSEPNGTAMYVNNVSIVECSATFILVVKRFEVRRENFSKKDGINFPTVWTYGQHARKDKEYKNYIRQRIH